MAQALDELTDQPDGCTFWNRGAEPDQQLIVYTAEPGSRSEHALRRLADRAAKNVAARR